MCFTPCLNDCIRFDECIMWCTQVIRGLISKGDFFQWRTLTRQYKQYTYYNVYAKKIVFMNVQIFLSKIQVFFQAFSTTTIFFRLKVIKYMYCMWSTNAGTKVFPWRVGKIEHTKNFTCEALVVAFKKLKTFYYFFKLQTFSRSGKLQDQFQEFFKNSRLCTNPDYIT